MVHVWSYGPTNEIEGGPANSALATCHGNIGSLCRGITWGGGGEISWVPFSSMRHSNQSKIEVKKDSKAL